MQVKTHGIVLHSLKHNDNSAIVTIYTEQFGRISYMVYGVGKKKAKFRSAFLQPLSLVELDVYHVPAKDIQTIKDVRVSYPFSGIPFDPVKNSLALFLSEVLYRVLRRSEPDEPLFDFVHKSVEALDCCEFGLANFHLVFLMKLTRYLGFEPNTDQEQLPYFDLMNGIYTTAKPEHMHYLPSDLTPAFSELLKADYLTMKDVRLYRDLRLKMIESIIEYYRLHVSDFHGLHSLSVLHALFD